MTAEAITIDGGALAFSVTYRALPADQGVSIEVRTTVVETGAVLLRFDCFEHAPQYAYDPEGKNDCFLLDVTTAGNPIGWALEQLRGRLPAMLARAGAPDVAAGVDPVSLGPKLDELERAARHLARTRRRTVTHNRGDDIIEADNLRFGLEFREVAAGRGVAIHVLSDVAGREIEVLAFDCFEEAAHYHYGPRDQDVRIFWDPTVVPDPLQWTLDQFKAGRLPAMIERAGYPNVAAAADGALIASVVTREVEPRALALRAAHAE